MMWIISGACAVVGSRIAADLSPDCPVVDRRGLERRRALRERTVVVLCLVACSCQPDSRDED